MLNIYRVTKAIILKSLANDGGRYILVGGVVYVFDFLIFSFFVFVSSDLYVIGNVVARVSGALLGFLLHRSWTFRTEYRHNKKLQLLMYVSLLSVNILASSVLLIIFVDLLLLGELYARIITDVVIITFTFIISKLFIFIGNKS
jgi:putative flippase GtrA